MPYRMEVIYANALHESEAWNKLKYHNHPFGNAGRSRQNNYWSWNLARMPRLNTLPAADTTTDPFLTACGQDLILACLTASCHLLSVLSSVKNDVLQPHHRPALSTAHRTAFDVISVSNLPDKRTLVASTVSLPWTQILLIFQKKGAASHQGWIKSKVKCKHFCLICTAWKQQAALSKTGGNYTS